MQQQLCYCSSIKNVVVYFVFEPPMANSLFWLDGWLTVWLTEWLVGITNSNCPWLVAGIWDCLREFSFEFIAMYVYDCVCVCFIFLVLVFGLAFWFARFYILWMLLKIYFVHGFHCNVCIDIHQFFFWLELI